MAVDVTSKWRAIRWQQKVIVVIIFIVLIGILSILQMSPNNIMSAELAYNHQQCEHVEQNKINTSWPKIIHQTWKDRNVPEKYKGFQESCRALNPDYKYMFWTDAELKKLIKEHYPWFVETLNTYPYKIQKVDAARLFLLHRFGGAYLDIDLKCNVPIKTIQEKAIQTNANVHTILAETKPVGVTNNMMMSKPRVPYMDFIIHRLLETKGHYFTPYWTVMLSTGPLFVYRTYMAYPCKHQIHIMSEHEHSHVYFTHAHAGTWHTWEGFLLKFFDHHGRTLLQVIAIIVAIILIQQLYKQIRKRIYTTKESDE